MNFRSNIKLNINIFFLIFKHLNFCEKKRRKWLELILSEKNQLAVLKFDLNDEKAELKKNQERIERDKTAVRRETSLARVSSTETEQK